MDKSVSYRTGISGTGLQSFTIQVRETDLCIRAQKDMSSEAEAILLKHRRDLEAYIKTHPSFGSSLRPLEVEPDVPLIVRMMAAASQMAEVGPMAAVAGTIAELVGRDLARLSPEVMVENGGDIFISLLEKRRVGLYAGATPFSGKIAVEIEPEETPLGICTSSGLVGHSLSFGNSDAVTVLSRSTPLADAAATRIANIIKSEEDIDRGIELAKSIKGLKGVIIMVGEKMGIWGEVRLCEALPK
jgi:hypothetical protein